MITMGVSRWMFLLAPAYPGSHGQTTWRDSKLYIPSDFTEDDIISLNIKRFCVLYVKCSCVCVCHHIKTSSLGISVSSYHLFKKFEKPKFQMQNVQTASVLTSKIMPFSIVWESIPTFNSSKLNLSNFSGVSLLRILQQQNHHLTLLI